MRSYWIKLLHSSDHLNGIINVTPGVILSVFSQACDLHHTNPCELGTHLFSLFDKSSLEQILGTLGVDEAVSGVQTLGLIHPASSFTDVTCMLSREQDMENKVTLSCFMSWEHFETMWKCLTSFTSDCFNDLSVLYLVYLRLDEEELYEGGGAFNGCVDVFKGKRLFANIVEMLSQEILNPQ